MVKVASCAMRDAMDALAITTQIAMNVRLVISQLLTKMFVGLEYAASHLASNTVAIISTPSLSTVACVSQQSIC